MEQYVMSTAVIMPQNTGNPSKHLNNIAGTNLCVISSAVKTKLK